MSIEDTETMAHDLAIELALLDCSREPIACPPCAPGAFRVATTLCRPCLAKWHVQGIRLLLQAMRGEG